MKPSFYIGSGNTRDTMDLWETHPGRAVVGSEGNCRTIGVWRLMSLLHQGPWTSLYLAQPADATGSPRWDYVVKVPCSSLQQQTEGALQIGAEISVSEAVRHPNITTVLDSNALGSHPYCVMPRIEGQTLEEILRDDSRQPLPVLLWWIRQATQGLGAVHQAGWVHRDVKPANMIVSSRGHLTVIDFGFASQMNHKETSVFRGTPDYAAPESLDGHNKIGPESDLFSLGRVLQQLIQTADSSNANVPESVLKLITRLTHPDRAERPTAHQLIECLLRLELETLGRHIRPTYLAA